MKSTIVCSILVCMLASLSLVASQQSSNSTDNQKIIEKKLVDRYGELFCQLFEEQTAIRKFIMDTFGQSSYDLSKFNNSYTNLISGAIANIKSSSRLTLVPRGTILQVALSIIEQSFNSEGKGLGDYNGWVVCNGQNGTPDLRKRFLVGQDLQSTEYSTIGKTGGRKTVQLNENNLPDHRHYVNFATSSGGSHSHFYKDIYYSESDSWRGTDYVNVPRNLGTGALSDFDNFGIQMSRYTNDAGDHAHQVTGYTDLNNKQAVEFDIRPEYYTVIYIMFTGVYNQKSTSQTNMGV